MLTKPRKFFKPIEYPQAEEYWLKQQQAHWLHTEIPMSSDIHDWKMNLNFPEKHLVGTTLKGFTQAEILVNDYWGTRVTRWFPKPEVCAMASCFANMESVHTMAYSYLNESLGLEDYEAFIAEPVIRDKLERLVNIETKAKPDIALSLAIFSAFTEGVSLYSSFAILLSFSRRNLLKGIGQIISFSVRDESLHSEAGCWLFRQFVSEYKDLFTDEIKKQIYEAARETVKLEDAFIDKAFEAGEIEDLDPKDLKEYIRHRANVKLGDLGMKSNWLNIDKEKVTKLDWFNLLTSGVEKQDFFAQRVSSYSKGTLNWDNF